jgi:alkanesulfonate monooxygenase SsuD/methylene tetrahydromethanopterin reductase-like flavin-dependent oxidoreductase (luciferase family)
VIVADSDAEALALWRDSGRFSTTAWFEPFGFRKATMDPDSQRYPTPEEAIEKGYALVGTVDTVTRALEKNMQRQPVDWLFCYTYNALIPHATLMRSVERFWTEVIPKFA